MNSKVSYSNTLISPSLGSNVTVIDRETQTSKISVNLMSSDQAQGNTTPKSTNAACKDDNIKVFEFCELVKDPQDDTVSIVKETFTEEVLTSLEGSSFGKPSHNRFKYCREVIQPYCKTHSTACPKYPTHREIPFKKSLSNTSKDSKNQGNSSDSSMSPDGKKATFENPSKTISNSSIKKDGKKRPCPPVLPLNTKKECQKEATNCEPYSKCPQYKDEAKLKEYLSSCLSTTVTMAKKASATCIDKCEKTIGIRQPKCGEEKPTYYVLKKPKSKDSIVDKSSYESILDSEIVQNFKSGVKSVVDTVINKTKKTVNTFTSGSCKDLQPDRKPRDVENKMLSKVASILPNKFKNQEDNGKASQNGSLTEIKSSLTDTFNSQETETNSKSSFSKITSILPNPFKSKENNTESSQNISMTKIESSLSNKSHDSGTNERLSLSQFKSMLPNPFKSEKDSDANKSSLTKITSIFTNAFKSKEDSDSENKNLTRIKTVLCNTITNTQDYAASIKDNIDMSKMVEPTVSAIERVASAVSTTASATILTVKNVKESLSMTNIINSRLDKSSPEDDPNIIRRKPPENISHERAHSHEPDDNNQSMFTMLKSKLFSMFADNTEDGDDESEDEDEIPHERMKTKKCTVEPPPPPPPPDPCKEQRIQQKIKAGIKICPPVPVEPPPSPPSCHALCIEKIKNFPVKVTNQPVVCTVEREETGQARCDKIRDLKAAHPDLPWPGCEPPPPPPPPPEPDLCELQAKRAKLEECKERMKRYTL